MLNLIGVYVTAFLVVVGSARRKDSDRSTSSVDSEHEFESAGKYISYSSSFGEEDFSPPDIPASFDRLYGINSSFHANKSHQTSGSLELKAVYPSSSASDDDNGGDRSRKKRTITDSTTLPTTTRRTRKTRRKSTATSRTRARRAGRKKSVTTTTSIFSSTGETTTPSLTVTESLESESTKASSYVFSKNTDTETVTTHETQTTEPSATSSQRLTTVETAQTSTSDRPTLKQETAITTVKTIQTQAPTTTEVLTTSTTEIPTIKITESPTTVKITKSSTAMTTLTTTKVPTTIKATEAPTTVKTTEAPTTIKPTETPTTIKTTEAPTTIKTTKAPTTVKTTEAPTTVKTTEAPTTVKTTEAPTTLKTTEAPTTVKTTEVPTTLKTTEAPTTVKITKTPTTLKTTEAPTTVKTSEVPTTLKPMDSPITTTETMTTKTSITSAIKTHTISTEKEHTSTTARQTTSKETVTSLTIKPMTALQQTTLAKEFETKKVDELGSTEKTHALVTEKLEGTHSTLYPTTHTKSSPHVTVLATSGKPSSDIPKHGVHRLAEHPIWEILRRTTSTLMPEPNIPRLKIRRRKMQPLHFKPPPEGWPGIKPIGNAKDFKIIEPEYTFAPELTTKRTFWEKNVTMSLAQELAQKYQMLTRKPYVPFVHSRQKDRVYSYRNASGYFIYVRERPTYFPTKATVPYRATFKFTYQQPPRRFDWRTSIAGRPGPAYVISNDTNYRYTQLNVTVRTLPPRYPMPQHMPPHSYYTQGAYYSYPKQGQDPQQPVYPPGPPPAYPRVPYPARPIYQHRPPGPYPPHPQYAPAQPYQPPHPVYPPPPRPPPLGVPIPQAPPPALGPPAPPYPRHAAYPPPHMSYQSHYPQGLPPQPPPPPPPYPDARGPYQQSPYQLKPVYPQQPVYRPPYPQAPAPPAYTGQPYTDKSGYDDEDEYEDPNAIQEQPSYSGPIQGFPMPSQRIRQPKPYYQDQVRSLFSPRSSGNATRFPSYVGRTLFPYITRGTHYRPGARLTMLPPSAWRRNKTFTYQDAFNRGFGRIRPLSYGKRVSSFGHVPVHELGPPPPKIGEGYAGNLTAIAKNTSHARGIFGYEPYRPKPKLSIYKGGFGYEPYRGPPGGKYKKPKGPDYVPYRPFRNKIDRLSLKEYVPYKPFRKDKDDSLPMRFDKSKRYTAQTRPTRSYTYPPRRDGDRKFQKETKVYTNKEPEVKAGLAAYLSEAQLRRMGKGKTLADMFADFFPPSSEAPETNKSKSDKTEKPTVSRKIPSLNQEEKTKPPATKAPAEVDDNIFDDSEALEALANTMVLKERPTPKPRGMTAKDAMRAAAREAQREMEMEDEENGIFSRRRDFNTGGRRGSSMRRGGARGSGRGQGGRGGFGGGGGRGGFGEERGRFGEEKGRGFGGGGGGRGGENAGRGGRKTKKKKNKKDKKKGKEKRNRRSIGNEEDSGSEEFVLIGNKHTWSSNEVGSSWKRPIVDVLPVKHQMRRGKGRPMVVHVQSQQASRVLKLTSKPVQRYEYFYKTQYNIIQSHFITTKIRCKKAVTVAQWEVCYKRCNVKKNRCICF